MKIQIVSAFVVAASALALTASGVAKSSSRPGTQLFQSQHCVMCHGQDGKGFAAIRTPDFTSPKWQATQTDAQITQVITDGKKGTKMPAFGAKLKAAQIEDLVHYIRSLNSAKKK